MARESADSVKEASHEVEITMDALNGGDEITRKEIEEEVDRNWDLAFGDVSEQPRREPPVEVPSLDLTKIDNDTSLPLFGGAAQGEGDEPTNKD